MRIVEWVQETSRLNNENYIVKCLRVYRMVKSE